ncbi:MAG: hypothetical protein JST85_26635 [Acidobacteria bacterium]|nr:hypothetical protein [Acidobacteriota bacterium]
MLKSIVHDCEGSASARFVPRNGKTRLGIVLLVSIIGWGCTPNEDELRQQHATALTKAETIGLPVSTVSGELESLERMEPLLDSVGQEVGGTKGLIGKTQIILRGFELLQSDTLYTRPGLESFQGAWDAIKTSWGGAARILPPDAAVALAAVETSFRSANSPLSSATGLWQLVTPKAPFGAQERFERPSNYWQQMYNDCFDKLDGVQNTELRKQTAGMLAHWLNNAHNVDRSPSAQELQDIRVPLVIAQYLNGPSLLNNVTAPSLRIVTQARAVGKNPPPRIYLARFAVYLAIVRAYIEQTQREGLGVADSSVSLEQTPYFQESVKQHLWWVLTTPNFGIELHTPSEPTMYEQAKEYITGS